MRGSPFQAGLAASRRPVLHVRASQAGLCAPKPVLLMPVSVALSPARVNGAFCRARLIGGLPGRGHLGAMAHPHPARVQKHGGRMPGAPLRERQRERERRIQAAVAGQVGQRGGHQPGRAAGHDDVHRIV